MAKRKSVESTSVDVSTTFENPYSPRLRNDHRGGLAQRDYPTDEVARPACLMGSLLADSCVEGVGPMVGNLLHGQFDEELGTADPASDIHSDRHLLADALLRRDISASKVNVVNSEPSENE